MKQLADNLWRQDLLVSGEHWLLLSRTESYWQIALESEQASRHSLLRHGFKRQLRLSAGGKTFQLAEQAGREVIRIPSSAKHCEILLGARHPFRIASLRLSPAVECIGSPYLLSPFESRYLAENGQPHPIHSDEFQTAKLITDLHVHFAGCICAADLLKIGIENDVRYPASLLEEAGIHFEQSGAVPLAKLPLELLATLRRHLEVPIDRQITFLEMERIYRLRAPITKCPSAFIPLCQQIAKDYAAMGVKHVELSMSDIVDSSRLREVQKHVPEIESKSGVRIRFLAAMSRHDDVEWDLDYIERLKQLVKCRYIAGVDFMGHETNSTRVFADRIAAIAKWADSARPAYVIRVHAGENPAYPENVRTALEAVGDYRVQLRIGHGLYGVDSQTIEEIRRKNVIVEFNLNSNFALNNIQASREIPIKRYLEAGINCVLGTDGYGIYQSSLDLEARAAHLTGLTRIDFEKLSDSEARYLKSFAEAEAATTIAPPEFLVPDDPPKKHFTPHVMARTKAEKERRDKLLQDRLAELEIKVLSETEAHELLRGKRCISFAGAWAKSWETISTQQKQNVRDVLAKLIAALDPQQQVLITGGTHYGVEHLVQSFARPRGFVVLGTLVRETPPNSIERNTISHALIVGETLFDKAAGLYRLVKSHEGLCLFIGGGNIVNDEIQTACNLRARYLLMDGPEGASTIHAREQPERGFKTADDVLRELSAMTQWNSTRENYWHLGANPTADMVLIRKNPRTQAREVLLIQRHWDAPTEPGKWAFPGGFQQTDAPRGTPWKPGQETARQTCVRELREETGLDLEEFVDHLAHVGDFEGGGRDPRDTPQSWSRSSVFVFQLPDEMASVPIAGGDDAGDARWVPLEPMPQNLAFDHDKILRVALARLS